jgi:20S proteasome alpha/beta subunit
MKRSASTGDGMIIAVVTKSGYTEYSGKDIEKIASQAK